MFNSVILCLYVNRSWCSLASVQVAKVDFWVLTTLLDSAEPFCQSPKKPASASDQTGHQGSWASCFPSGCEYLAFSLWSRVPLLDSILEQGWCHLIPRLLLSPEHDSREKVLSAMALLMESCKAAFVQSETSLNTLHEEYRVLSEEEKAEEGEELYFGGLLRTVDSMLGELRTLSQQELWRGLECDWLVWKFNTVGRFLSWKIVKEQAYRCCICTQLCIVWMRNIDWNWYVECMNIGCWGFLVSSQVVSDCIYVYEYV